MNGKIYVSQDCLNITINGGKDLSVATNVKMMYRKKDGTVGSWSNVSVVEETKIRYSVENRTILDQNGLWTFWGEADIAGKHIIGEPAKYMVYLPGY